MLKTKTKVRGISRDVHPAEMAEFLVENAPKIRTAAVLADYDEGDREHTHVRYVGTVRDVDIAWWIAVLQDELRIRMAT